MAQHDYNLANQNGAAFRADLNNALSAIASNNKGNSRPTSIGAGQIWVDDNTPSSTVWSVYFYDGTDDIKIGEFDTTANNFMPFVNGSSLSSTYAATSSVVGKQTICIPAFAMSPRRTNGCASLAWTNGATDQPDIPYLAFDGASNEYASFIIPMPKGWNEGTVTAKFFWRRASGTGAADVVWGIRGLARGNSEAPATNFGSAATVVAAADTTTADIAVSSETSACTIGGTPAEGDLVFFEVLRNGGSGSDTLDAVDAWLTAVQLFYTTDAATDA